MDRLLTACHGSPSLNLFVESFLKMVQRLLETSNAELQLLATQSFVNFSNIEEDAPSYHRRYDFFISKFSAMCHSSNSGPALKRSLRLAGLKGRPFLTLICFPVNRCVFRITRRYSEDRKRRSASEYLGESAHGKDRPIFALQYARRRFAR